MALGTLVRSDRLNSVVGRKARPFGCALGFGLLIAGWIWYTHLPVPPAEDRELFRGIRFVRQIRQSPRPMVLNIAIVDLTQPGIRFDNTDGGNGKFMIRASRTSEFLAAEHAQLAVNASFFWPFRSHHPLSYYPHEGDPVRPCGLYAHHGRIITGTYKGFPSLYFDRRGKPGFDAPADGIYDAISGNFMLLRHGDVESERRMAFDQRELQPRTAVGLSKDGKTLFLVVVDGRQPNCSEGIGLEELARAMRGLGAWDALNLDGGGSEAMAMEGRDGMPVLLNRPIDLYIPGRERIVATQLAVFADPIPWPKRESGR